MKTAMLLLSFTIPSLNLLAASPAATPATEATGLHPQVLAALAGAIVAGLFALGVGFLSHRREMQARNDEWMRDKLFSIYSDAIYYLIKLSLSARTKTVDDKDVRQHFSEAQRFLNLLRGYHSGNTGTTTKLQQCSQALAAASDDKTQLVKEADSALTIVKDLFEIDDRIQIRAKK